MRWLEGSKVFEPFLPAAAALRAAWAALISSICAARQSVGSSRKNGKVLAVRHLSDRAYTEAAFEPRSNLVSITIWTELMDGCELPLVFAIAEHPDHSSAQPAEIRPVELGHIER